MKVGKVIIAKVRCTFSTQPGPHQREFQSPILSPEVNPFPSRFIYKMTPLCAYCCKSQSKQSYLSVKEITILFAGKTCS